MNEKITWKSLEILHDKKWTMYGDHPNIAIRNANKVSHQKSKINILQILIFQMPI